MARPILDSKVLGPLGRSNLELELSLGETPRDDF